MNKSSSFNESFLPGEPLQLSIGITPFTEISPENLRIKNATPQEEAAITNDFAPSRNESRVSS